MRDKGFNIFNECTSRCVHLSPQEEDWTSSSWGYSKMYTSGSIANSQRMLTGINESGAIAKISVRVESDAVKHLKQCRIISSKMEIPFLILNWWYFSCLHIQIIFFYFHISLNCFFKSLCWRYTAQLFWKIIAYEQ